MITLGCDAALACNVYFDGNALHTVANKASELRTYLRRYPPGTRLGVEATGVCHELVCRIAYELGMTVFVIQGSWMKAYRKGLGFRAKTDKIDARAIHDYVVENAPRLHEWKPLPKLLEKLRRTVRQRRGLAKDRTTMLQRYRALGLDKRHVDALLHPLDQLVKRLDKELILLLKQIPTANAVLSIPGVGVQTASAALCALEHIPFKNSEAFVAYVGIDPVPRDSGASSGPRRISKKGDTTLRSLLFLSAISATRSKAWKPRYEKLIQKKQKMKALLALARKIAVTIFSVHKYNLKFNAERLDMKL